MLSKIKNREVVLLGLFCAALYLFASNAAYAKWATIEDAPIKSSYSKSITINKDGTFEAVKEADIVILKESGREAVSNTTIFYNEDSQNVEILEAYTVYKGKKFYLNKNLLEDKPVASSPSGFDQMRQILLSFPKAEVGSTIHYKYKLRQTKPNLKDFFDKIFYFGAEEFVTKENIKIKSKLPLYTVVNDPTKALKVVKSKSKGDYVLDITLTKPIYTDVRNEPNGFGTAVNDKYFTWVSVSSLKDWQEFAVRYGDTVTDIYTQKLPQTFEKILKSAKGKSTEVEQIDTVTSLLNDKVRYMGDWRTVQGKFVPRKFAEVSDTRLGDCKDFSAITAAILTKLGFKAQYVLVLRGLDGLSKDILPGFNAFNHAIVKVTGKNGKVYWVDPTNFESMANGIFPDIAGKMALVVDPRSPSYEKIPNVDPNSAVAEIKRTLEVLDNGKIVETGNLLLKNEITLGLAGGALKTSEDTIKGVIFKVLADQSSLSEKDKNYMTLPKLNSRIVKDIFIEYSFNRVNNIFKTNEGLALKLTYGGSIPGFFETSQDHVSDVLINSSPITMKRETIIKNINVNNVEVLNAERKSKWLYVKRECKLNKNNELQINDTIITYINFVPSEDFKKKEFIEFKEWLENNFKNVIIVFRTKK